MPTSEPVAAFAPPRKTILPAISAPHHGDPDAAVLRAALGRRVARRRVVLREADDLHARPVEVVGPLEVAGDGPGAGGRELPVARVGAGEVRADGLVVGVAFDADLAPGVVAAELCGDLGEARHALRRELGAAGGEEDVGREDGDGLAALAVAGAGRDAVHCFAVLAVQRGISGRESVDLVVGGGEVLAEVVDLVLLFGEGWVVAAGGGEGAGEGGEQEQPHGGAGSDGGRTAEGTPG